MDPVPQSHGESTVDGAMAARIYLQDSVEGRLAGWGERERREVLNSTIHVARIIRGAWFRFTPWIP